MNLRQLIREVIQERLSQYPIHLTLDDRDSTFERFGVVMSRNYTDPQMAIVRLKDGSEALAVWDINSNIVRLISSEKKKLGALLFKRDYANDTLTPASGVNNQTIQVDPASRRNGVAFAMMDYLADKIGPWDFSRIDPQEPISEEAIATFKNYIYSRPSNVVNAEASITRLEKSEAGLHESVAPETYHGEHEAPTREETPMYDLKGGYPDDFYKSDGARMYGSGDSNIDHECHNIICSVKGRPNKPVKIYRAVPNVNHEVDKEISELWGLLAYREKFPFFPVGDNAARRMADVYAGSGLSYDEIQQKVIEDMNARVMELQKQRQKNIGINPGDWVTISRKYAKQHGEDNLLGKYKIVSKVVKAGELFTDCNDLAEWGYQP